MRKLFFTVICILCFVRCSSAPITDASSVEVDSALESEFSLPLPIPISYYISQKEQLEPLNQGFSGNLYPAKRFNDAAELILPHYFQTASAVKDAEPYTYLFVFETEDSYQGGWQGFQTVLSLTVTKPEGEKIFTVTVTKRQESNAGKPLDVFYQLYAEAIKEATIRFLNQRQKNQVDNDIAGCPLGELPSEDLASILPDFDAKATGSGFYINALGDILTAAHVVRDCSRVEVRTDQGISRGTVSHASLLLDLAVIRVEACTTNFATFGEPSAYLGESVFTMGYPLSNLLSDSPNLTKGNVSALGGMKGSKGLFQFTAPIQPGSSGGPVVDFQGNVEGLIASTLNQSVMLSKAGVAPQNVNFGVTSEIIRRFLRYSGVHYSSEIRQSDLRQASESAAGYTVQVICY